MAIHLFTSISLQLLFHLFLPWHKTKETNNICNKKNVIYYFNIHARCIVIYWFTELIYCIYLHNYLKSLLYIRHLHTSSRGGNPAELLVNNILTRDGHQCSLNWIWLMQHLISMVVLFYYFIHCRTVIIINDYHFIIINQIRC